MTHERYVLYVELMMAAALSLFLFWRRMPVARRRSLLNASRNWPPHWSRASRKKQKNTLLGAGL
ncbi:hypothetical protein SZ66_20110 [Pantoea ananatis]|nr:hypothetical protein [Pantoea ananatis]